MQITCGFCKYQGEADEFTPRDQACGPDWVCPKCLVGTYVPSTLTADDLIGLLSQDARP
jgi:hypothetical protein